FALTALLLPGLLRSPAARVVTVSSVAHHIGRPGGRPRPGHYHPWAAYGRSKLANFHFGLGLHKVFTDAGVPCASLVADPGLPVPGPGLHADGPGAGHAGAGRWSRRLLAAFAARFGTTPGRAALPQIRAATDPRARSGEYYAPLLVAGGPPVRRPILRRLGLDHAIHRLWTVSEHATGLALNPAAVRRLVRAWAGGGCRRVARRTTPCTWLRDRPEPRSRRTPPESACRDRGPGRRTICATSGADTRPEAASGRDRAT